MIVTRLHLEGVLCSGLGEGSRFTRLDWATREFADKLGFVPHPGTFNLRMEGATWERARHLLSRQPGIAIVAAAGYCGAKCFSVAIGGRVNGALVLPQVPAYPADKLEIVAPLSLRQALRVNNSDRVRLWVDIPQLPSATRD